MIFENKFMEGNIYVFYYYEGITGVVASLMAQLLYVLLKTKKAFIVSIALVLFGFIMIIIVETNAINPEFFSFLAVIKSPYRIGTPENKQYYVKAVIPLFILFTKIAVNILY